MATDAAVSTTTTVANSIKAKFYVETFMKNYDPKLVHKQLGQMNQSIDKGQGGYGTGVVQWTKWAKLPLVTAGQGEGKPTTAVSMSATVVTGSTAQYDQAVSVSDLLAYTSFGDVMKAALERLGANAGLSIDTVVRNAVAEAGTVRNETGVANWTAVPSTATINISSIRKARRVLAHNDAPTHSDGSYLAVIHSDALYDLMGDTTTGGWIDASKYSNPEKIYNAEAGKMLGVRFLETTNAYVKGTGVATSASVYVTSFFAPDAFGVTNLQNLETFVKGFGSAGTADPTNKVATAGWKATFGTTPLDSNLIVSYYHAVSSTAA